jgi:hypothetical protein
VLLSTGRFYENVGLSVWAEMNMVPHNKHPTGLTNLEKIKYLGGQDTWGPEAHKVGSFCLDGYMILPAV